MNSFASIVTLTSVLFFSPIFSYAAEAPACSDKAVTETVRKLFWEQKLGLGNAPLKPTDLGYKHLNEWQIYDVTSSGYNTGIKRRGCSASTGTGKRPTAITYTVQLTEAKDKFIVRADFSDLPDAFALVMNEVYSKAIESGK